MRLFFDVETTGLPERNLPPNDPRQPHLVQLACLLCEDDGTERASVSLIVRPPVPIPDEVAAIHGITNGIAAAAGVPPAAAFGIWSNLARRAGTLVAHNIAFDEAIMLTAWCRQHVGSAEAAADGTTTIWFAPKQPEGVARGNWIETLPGKGWFVILRLYSPLGPFFDRSWRIGEVQPAG